MLTGAGLYPTPIGKAGIAAVDVRDIANAAVVSLTTEGHTGKTYNLIGPDPLSGPSAAAIWSEVLKQVRYADLPLEAFEEQIRRCLPFSYDQVHSAAVSRTKSSYRLGAWPISEVSVATSAIR